MAEQPGGAVAERPRHQADRTRRSAREPPATSSRPARSPSAATTNAAAAERRCTGTATASACFPSTSRCAPTYGVGVDWPIGYDELSPWYDEAEREIGVAADVEDQQRIGLRFTPGYVYPMFKVPPSYLDRWLGERLDGTPVAIGDGTYRTGVVPVPGGRNSTPNPAYDGGRGYTPVGAVGRPETGLRCEGNASCIPACPAQAKYSALKTLAAAATAGARVIHQTVANRVVVGPDGDVAGIDYLAWTGNTFPQATSGTITATRYVLAAHSVENAKLLLMSGAANTSDQVGRNLMDHPFLLSWGLADEPLGTFRGPGSTSGIETLRDGPYRADHAAFRVDIDNWGFGILGAPVTDVTSAVFDDGLHGAALRQRLADVVPRQLLLGFLLEQLPDPDNRVTIDASKWTDATRLAPADPALRHLDAYTRAGAAAARSCAEQWFEEVGAEDLTDFGPGHSPVMHQDFEWHGRPYATMGAGHLCGTHRMGDDPATSVVDSEQRSWDHRNLFIVGAGSMPTIGTSNPTLTLAALACRTAAAILGDLAVIATRRGHRDVAAITDLDQLRAALQTAIELEHSTIPPYLCALYSLRGGSNVEAAELIESVVMEEMLHMVLAANVLNAIGGTPSIGHPGFVPRYPCTLPHSDGRLVVHLRRFSPEAVDTFLRDRATGAAAGPTAGRPVPHDRPVLRRDRRSACSFSPPSRTCSPATRRGRSPAPVGSTAWPANRSPSSTSTARCRRWPSSSTRARASITRSTTATRHWAVARCSLTTTASPRSPLVAASGHRTRRAPGRPDRPCRSTSTPCGRCARTRRVDELPCTAATYGRSASSST